MIYTEAPLKGAYIIDMQRIEDERGWFSRTFCKEEFEANGLCCDFVQHNASHSIRKGTIRGLHYQLPPYEEIKVVRCTMGKIFDVIVDIRADSDTYLQWFSVELSGDNGRMLYIPKGFAHGFQTLCENSEVFYLMSAFYRKGYESGIRWNDAALNINWPIRDGITISEKDASFVDFPRLASG